MANAEEKVYKLSIIILNYKTESITLDLLKFLGHREDTEIILVDNSPKNNLETQLSSFINLKYFFIDKNLGFAGGVNFGIAKARGEWIMLLNSDTKATLSQVYELIHETEKTGYRVSTPKIQNNQGEIENNVGLFDSLLKHPINYLFARPRALDCKNIDKSIEVDWVTGAAVLIKKEVINKVGGFDDKSFFMYFEDLDFSYKLKRNNISILFIPKIQITHIGGASTASEQDNKFRYYINGRFNYLIKHRGWLIATLNKYLLILK